MVWDKFKRAVEQYHLLEKKDRVIIGVSGGVDSMVLLHLLNACRKELDLTLIIAHVNHGLRPGESEEEARLVRAEAERLHLPFECTQADARQFSRARGFSLQEACRKIRLHFFKALLLKLDARKVALGHNADDQVETVLLRLLRGSGVKGLKGMLPMRDGVVIRPLLEVWRREIESFALEKEIPFLTDSSNLKKDYLRNRLRLNLIPLIEREYQPRFRERVLRTSALLRGEDGYLEKEAEGAYRKMVHEEEGVLSFSISDYQSLDKVIRWRFLQEFLRGVYKQAGRMEEEGGSSLDLVFRQLNRSSTSFILELSHGLWLEKQYDQVFILKRRLQSVPPFEVQLPVSGRAFIPEIGKEVLIQEIEGEVKTEDLDRGVHVAHFDLELLCLPLKVRNFRPGDRFWPLGAKGAQKVKEFFIDHKIPRFERARVPLLISGEIIAWIVGHRIDNRVKITEKTRKALRIEVVDTVSKDAFGCDGSLSREVSDLNRLNSPG